MSPLYPGDSVFVTLSDLNGTIYNIPYKSKDNYFTITPTKIGTIEVTLKTKDTKYTKKMTLRSFVPVISLGLHRNTCNNKMKKGSFKAQGGLRV